MAEKTNTLLFPAGIVVSMLTGAVWINGSLSKVDKSVSLLSEKFDHSVEMREMRFAAVEARTTAIEQRASEVRSMFQWIIQFKAMNPEIDMPELP